MKKRLTGKPACVAILASLITVSLADVILRSAIFSFDAIAISNVGEPFMTVLFSVLLIVFAVKEKERLFYILFGAFLFYFVLNQLFELPEVMITIFSLMHQGNWVLNFGDFGGILSIAGMICIIITGGLLVEYMNDGSIYKHAFNGFCIAAVLMQAVAVITHIHAALIGAPVMLFVMFNNLQRICMVFLLAYFAYDSAKKQLKKIKL